MARPQAPPPNPVRPVSSGPSGLLIGLVVVLVVALVAGLLWAVTRDGADLEAEGSANALPQGAGVPVGPGPEAEVTQLHVYEDFQCPYCHQLEDSVGEELSSLVAEGEVAVTYTMMSFLDGNRGNTASSRSANAALCADDADRFADYHEGIYGLAPGNPDEGWSDDELISLAGSVGITGRELDTFTGCVADEAYAEYVDAMQERANQDGITGTPRLLIDGEGVSNEDLEALILGQTTLENVLQAPVQD